MHTSQISDANADHGTITAAAGVSDSVLFVDSAHIDPKEQNHDYEAFAATWSRRLNFRMFRKLAMNGGVVAAIDVIDANDFVR